MINCKLMIDGQCKNCSTECSKLKSYKEGFKDALKPIDMLCSRWIIEDINEYDFIDEVSEYIALMKKETSDNE